MFEKHYRGENSLPPNAEEFRTPSVIAMLMFKGSIYAGAVFFGAVGFIIILRCIAWYLPAESQMGQDPNSWSSTSPAMSFFELKLPPDDPYFLLNAYKIYRG